MSDRLGGPRPGQRDELDERDLSRLSYEDLIDQLRGLNEKMSSDDVGIEAAAELYATAIRLHREAAERLERVCRRIEGIERDTGGQARGNSG